SSAGCAARTSREGGSTGNAIDAAASETEPRLQLDDASRESAWRLSEERIAGDAVAADGRILRGRERQQIQRVEHVVGEDLHVQPRAIADDRRLRKAERLADRQVDREVAWPAEGIATDLRLRKRARRREGRQREIRQSPVRKIAVWLHERRVAEVASRAAEILPRPQDAITAVGVNEIDASVVRRRPRISRVCIENTAQRPAAGNLLEPRVSSGEDRRRPYTPQLEVVRHVVVRGPVRRVDVERIQVDAEILGSLIGRPRQLILKVERERAREPMLQLGEQRVVV